MCESTDGLWFHFVTLSLNKWNLVVPVILWLALFCFNQYCFLILSLKDLHTSWKLLFLAGNMAQWIETPTVKQYEFGSKKPHDGRRKETPESCPSTSKQTPEGAGHTHRNTKSNKKINLRYLKLLWARVTARQVRTHCSAEYLCYVPRTRLKPPTTSWRSRSRSDTIFAIVRPQTFANIHTNKN